MYIIMKTLCILGIPNWHNIHNLKYSQNSTSAVPQVIVSNVTKVHKVPNQHIIYFTCPGRAAPVWSRLCPIRLHHVFASSPKVLGPALQVWTSCFFGTWFFGESVHSVVLHRLQDRSGSPKQAQMWPYGSTYFIVPETPAFAEIRSIYFGLWCAKNGALNHFSHSLFIEIPSRDSLLARTEIKTQNRPEAAVEAVSAVSACHRETVLDSTGYRCRSPGPLWPLQATVRDALRCPERSPPGQSLRRVTVHVIFDISNTTTTKHDQGHCKLAEGGCSGGRVWF